MKKSNLIIKKSDMFDDKVNKTYNAAAKKGLVNNEFLLVCGFPPNVSIMEKPQKCFVMRALYFNDYDLLDNIEKFFNKNKKADLLIIEDINLCFKCDVFNKNLIYAMLSKICTSNGVCGFISDLY